GPLHRIENIVRQGIPNHLVGIGELFLRRLGLLRYRRLIVIASILRSLMECYEFRIFREVPYSKFRKVERQKFPPALGNSEHAPPDSLQRAGFREIDCSPRQAIGEHCLNAAWQLL